MYVCMCGWTYREHQRVAHEELDGLGKRWGGWGRDGFPAVVAGDGWRGLGVDVLHERRPELHARGIASEEVRLDHSHERAGISLGERWRAGLNKKRGEGLVLMRGGT